MKRLKTKEGMTLVETMVSILLVMIMLTMVVAVVSPAFKVFIRMQRLQFAQMILDNVEEDMKAELRDATTYVKIYETDGENGTGIIDKDGVNKGEVLEYVNTEGYIVLVSANGCAATNIYRGNTKSGQYDLVPKGQLLYRYYLNTKSVEGQRATYNYTMDGEPSARAATTAFGSGYYMGSYLKIAFAFYGETCNNGDTINGIKVSAYLYDSSEMKDEDLVAQEDFVIDFRYKVVREDGNTAVAGTTESSP